MNENREEKKETIEIIPSFVRNRLCRYLPLPRTHSSRRVGDLTLPRVYAFRIKSSIVRSLKSPSLRQPLTILTHTCATRSMAAIRLIHLLLEEASTVAKGVTFLIGLCLRLWMKCQSGGLTRRGFRIDRQLWICIVSGDLPIIERISMETFYCCFKLNLFVIVI